MSHSSKDSQPVTSRSASDTVEERPPPPRHPEDLKLVETCINGSRAGWATLLERYERTIYFAIVNTLRAQGASLDPDRIADIQGDLIVAMARERFRKLRLYSGRSRLAQWLKVVACNYTIDALRREKPVVSLSGDDPLSEMLRQTLLAPDMRPDQQVEQQQMLGILRKLCLELPVDDQRFVQLFFHQELTFAEVAEQMDTTLDAVYTRKNRIRNRLLRLARKRGYLTLKPQSPSKGGR